MNNKYFCIDERFCQLSKVNEKSFWGIDVLTNEKKLFKTNINNIVFIDETSLCFKKIKQDFSNNEIYKNLLLEHIFQSNLSNSEIFTRNTHYNLDNANVGDYIYYINAGVSQICSITKIENGKIFVNFLGMCNTSVFDKEYTTPIYIMKNNDKNLMCIYENLVTVLLKKIKIYLILHTIYQNIKNLDFIMDVNFKPSLNYYNVPANISWFITNYLNSYYTFLLAC